MEAVYGTKPWAELSAEDRKREARVMEVYAAMIESKLTSLGGGVEMRAAHSPGRSHGHRDWPSDPAAQGCRRVVQHHGVFLQRQRCRRDFASLRHRQRCAADILTRLEAIPIMGEALQASISKHYDNSFDNIGAGNSVRLTQSTITSGSPLTELAVHLDRSAVGTSSNCTLAHVQGCDE